MNFNKILLASVALISFSNILSMDSLDSLINSSQSNNQKKINCIYVKCVDLRPVNNSKNGSFLSYKCLDGIPTLAQLKKTISDAFFIKKFYLVDCKTYSEVTSNFFQDKHNIKALTDSDFNQYGKITLYAVITSNLKD